MDTRSDVRPKPASETSGARPDMPGAADMPDMTEIRGAGSATVTQQTTGQQAAGRQTTGYQDQEVSELVDQAKRTASETASGAGHMVRQRVDEQYHRLGEGLDGVVKNMHEVADGLNQRGSQGTGNLVNSATRQIERVNGYVQSNSAEDVLSDANRYAKQHPWTVLAGAAVAGLLVSRFLKASMTGMSTDRQMGRRPGA